MYASVPNNRVVSVPGTGFLSEFMPRTTPVGSFSLRVSGGEGMAFPPSLVWQLKFRRGVECYALSFSFSFCSVVRHGDFF